MRNRCGSSLVKRCHYDTEKAKSATQRIVKIFGGNAGLKTNRSSVRKRRTPYDHERGKTQLLLLTYCNLFARFVIETHGQTAVLFASIGTAD
jgi:hypothetical protein